MKPLVAAVAVLVAIAACGCGSSSQLPIGEVYESVSGRTHLVVQTDTEVDVLGFDTADLSSNQVYGGTYRIQEDGRVRVSVPAYGRALRVFSLEPIDEGLREVDAQGTLTTNILFDRQHIDEARFRPVRIRAEEGDAVAQDALTAWTQATEGDAEAQRNLGNMYRTGRGVPEDAAEAVRWYRLAAEQGEARAQVDLGNMYRSGEGVPEDAAEAVRWYRLAAEQGEARAQVDLGFMYATGEGVPQDDAEAVRWLRLAAEQGLARAQVNLGVMYATGEGVPQDYVEAHMWYDLAAAQSSGEDRDALVNARDSVAERMTAEQIAEAQRRAREWKPTPEP